MDRVSVQAAGKMGIGITLPFRYRRDVVDIIVFLCFTIKEGRWWCNNDQPTHQDSCGRWEMRREFQKKKKGYYRNPLIFFVVIPAGFEPALPAWERPHTTLTFMISGIYEMHWTQNMHHLHEVLCPFCIRSPKENHLWANHFSNTVCL